MNSPDIKWSIMSLGWGPVDGDRFHSWLPEAKEAGFDGVSGFVDKEFRPFLRKPEELLRILDRHGLSLGSANMGMPQDIDQEMEHVEAVCQFLRQMRCNNLVVVGGKGKEEADFLRLAEGLNRMGEMAVQYEIDLVYHHHTHYTGETFEDMDRLLSLTEPGKVGVMLDTGHATVDFVNQPLAERPLQFLEKYWDRMTLIELKDWEEKAGLKLPLGEGNCNFNGIFQLLKNKGYQGWITVEFNGTDHSRTPKEYAAISREFIRRGMGI